jgi:hypothetical protein
MGYTSTNLRWNARLAGSSVILGLAALLLAAPDRAPAQDKDEPQPLKAATATAGKIDKDGHQTVTVTVEMNQDWYIYANPVDNPDLANIKTSVKISGNQKLEEVKITSPAGEKKTEGLAGETISYLIYEGKVEITATVKRASGDAGPLDVSLKYNACNKKNPICLPTAQIKVVVK